MDPSQKLLPKTKAASILPEASITVDLKIAWVVIIIGMAFLNVMSLTFGGPITVLLLNGTVDQLEITGTLNTDLWWGGSMGQQGAIASLQEQL